MAEKEVRPWPVTLTPLDNGRDWRVVEIAPRRSKTLGKKLAIPFGFVTDLASIPAALRSLVAKWGRHGMAAIWHDYLYRTPLPGVTRKQADRVMLEFMTEDGVGRIKRRAIYSAVRLFGRKTWRLNKCQ